MNDKEQITIVGAGLVGSLLSILISKAGYKVEVMDKRPDPTKGIPERGRSINLALSHRGIKALKLADIDEKVLSSAIPMHGRMIHDLQGQQHLQPYGKEGQFIHSISRSVLNQVLIAKAKEEKVNFRFENQITDLDLNKKEKVIQEKGKPLEVKEPFGILIGADGAFSQVRGALQKTDRFDLSQEYLSHGYKELTIPPDGEGKHRLHPNALHIWPREKYMLIALPNEDGSFTCTLFLPFEGSSSFEELRTENDVRLFFEENFPDTLAHMPELTREFFSNPTSSLITVKCSPWTYKGHTTLIGDAAHAIVPFYGQGMNAGFEDCAVLYQLLLQHKNDTAQALKTYQTARKPNADAIAQLALSNFIEMRDLVNDKEFILRKKIEARIHEKYGERYQPLYTMVTFSDKSYYEALQISKLQDELMAEVLRLPDIATYWDKDVLWQHIQKPLEKYFQKLEFGHYEL